MNRDKIKSRLVNAGKIERLVELLEEIERGEWEHIRIKRVDDFDLVFNDSEWMVDVRSRLVRETKLEIERLMNEEV